MESEVGIKLDFDEALYIYNLLRGGFGTFTPDFFPIEAQLDRENDNLLQFLDRIGMSPEQFFSHNISEQSDDHWEACQFYSRIVPKLLKVYPELYRMRS